MAKVLPVTALRGNGADYLRTYHQIKVEPDVTIDDIMRPGFWAHHTNVLRPDDLIDILSIDGGLDVQVRVISKGIGLVNVRPLRIWVREVDATASEEPDISEVPDGYAVNFAPAQRWRAMTVDPHMIVSKDHKSRSDAIRAALDHRAKAQGIAA